MPVLQRALVRSVVLTRQAGVQGRFVMRLGVNAADLAMLDPHFASGTQDRTVVDVVFNALARFKPGDSSVIEPDLATGNPRAGHGG